MSFLWFGRTSKKPAITKQRGCSVKSADNQTPYERTGLVKERDGDTSSLCSSNNATVKPKKVASLNTNDNDSLIFESETGCSFDINDIVSVCVFCDPYGASLVVNGKQYIAWYKVDLKPGASANGEYAYKGYGYILSSDFSRLKQILEPKGWKFQPAKTKAPWFADGEKGIMPPRNDNDIDSSTTNAQSYLPIDFTHIQCRTMIEKDEAYAAFRSGQLEKSRELLHQVHNTYPDDIDVYVQLAKIEMSRCDWHEATYAIIMWIELLIYEIKAKENMSEYLETAKQRISQLKDFETIMIKDYAIPTERILQLLNASFGTTNVALSASVDNRPFLMLGYCYMRMFPNDVASYNLPNNLIACYQQHLIESDHAICSPMSNADTLIYGIGLLMALANIKGDIKVLENRALMERWNRRPSYAVYTQTVENAKAFRDNWMQHILNFTINEVRNAYNCTIYPRFVAHIEDMLMNENTYGNSLLAMLGATGQPLTTVPTGWVHTAEEINKKLKDLRSVGDVYGMQFEVEVDDDDYIVSPTSYISDEQLAEWLSKRINRNVYCGGTNRKNGDRRRIFSYFDIIQI